MVRVLRNTVPVVLLLIAWAGSSRADDDSFKRSQYYRGVTSTYVVTDVTRADLNGDASEEVVVCYREPGDAVNQQGGVLVLTSGMGGWVVAWHALFENVYPKKVRAADRSLSFDLVQTTMQEDREIPRSFVLGKDFFFRNQEGNTLYNPSIEASSTLEQDGIAPENVYDRNLQTAWAEGATGTGVDEKVIFEFSKPVHLGLIGVLHGNYQGRRAWRDNNRLHRAAATVETSSDRYDVDSEIDFEEDLGLGLYGDRVEMSFSNKPVMRYFKVGKKNVVSLELKITSVLLGEKNDDAYITEVDFAELIPASRVFGTEKKKEKTAEQAEQKKTTEEPQEDEPQDDWTEDDDW